MIKRLSCLILSLLFVLLFAACNGKGDTSTGETSASTGESGSQSGEQSTDESGSQSGEQSTDESDSGKQEDTDNYMSIIKDKLFKGGFDISYMNENAYVDYAGKASGIRQWVINEEGSFDQFNATTPVEEENGFYVIKSPKNSKVFKVNTTTGQVYMELNAEVDYGNTPRKDGQSWPHILICQNYSEFETPYLDSAEEVRLSMDFDFVKFEDVMGKSADKDLHACQFQWYVTIQNTNKESPDYGDFFWFGLQFFDNRYTFCPKGLIVDQGKDTATGKAIYTMDMKRVMKLKPVEQGESYSVDYDILPEVKKALEAVTQLEDIDCFKNTNLSDLRIGHTNIGWEMPGTYNGAVMINSFDIRVKNKKQL